MPRCFYYKNSFLYLLSCPWERSQGELKLFEQRHPCQSLMEDCLRLWFQAIHFSFKSSVFSFCKISPWTGYYYVSIQQRREASVNFIKDTICIRVWKFNAIRSQLFNLAAFWKWAVSSNAWGYRKRVYNLSKGGYVFITQTLGCNTLRLGTWLLPSWVHIGCLFVIISIL